MNTSITPTAAVVATGLAGIAVFQIALAIGAPLGQAAWGGAQTEAPTRLRFGSAASAVFLTPWSSSAFMRRHTKHWATSSLTSQEQRLQIGQT